MILDGLESYLHHNLHIIADPSPKHAPFELLYGFPPRSLVASSSGYRPPPPPIYYHCKHGSSGDGKEGTSQGPSVSEEVDMHRRPVTFEAGQVVWLRTTSLPKEATSKSLREPNKDPFDF